MPSHQEFTSAESVTLRISAAVRSKHVRREVKFACAIDRLSSTPRPGPAARRAQRLTPLDPPLLSPPHGAMPSLHVDLLEGFNDDTVVMRVDGREVHRLDGVRTNYSVGIAARFDVDIPPGAVRVELVVPERGLICRIEHGPRDPDGIAFALSPTGQITARHTGGPSRTF